jgi:hypothetical protein
MPSFFREKAERIIKVGTKGSFLEIFTKKYLLKIEMTGLRLLLLFSVA